MRAFFAILALGTLVGAAVWLWPRAEPAQNTEVTSPDEPGGPLLVPAAARVEAPASSPAMESALYGRVLDALQNPISGCEIAAQAHGARVHWRDGGGEALRTHSGADGRFSLAVSAGVPLVVTLSHHDFPPTVVATQLMLRPGKPRDLGDLELRSEPGLSVLVVDAQERPLEGALLELRPAVEDAELPGHPLLAARRHAVTAADGQATFYGVRSGHYVLRAEADGAALKEQPHQQLENTRVQRAVVRLVPGITVRGVLLTDAGAPVAQTLVRALPHGDLPITTAVTAQDGGFRWSGLQPGMVRVEIESAVGRRVLPDVRVGAGEPLELRLPTGASLRGRVLREPDGLAVAGALVQLADAWAFEYSPQCLTDTSGRFHLQGLQQGEHSIELQVSGYPTQRFGPFPTGTDNDCWLRPGTELRGRVTDLDGNPLRGIQVDVISADHDGRSFSELLLRVGNPRRLVATTGADGGFRIPGVSGGRFRVRAQGPDHPLAASEPFHVRSEAGLDVGALRLPLPCHLRGLALDPRGQPAARARVKADPIGGPWRSAVEATCGADGRFVLGPLASGEYELSIVPHSSGPAATADFIERSRTRVLVEPKTPEVTLRTR